MNSKEIALDIFNYALESVLPKALIEGSVRLEGGDLVVGNEHYDLKRFNNVYVFGSGKASYGMADAIEDLLGERISGGFVISNTPPDSHTNSHTNSPTNSPTNSHTNSHTNSPTNSSTNSHTSPRRIEFFEGSHPVPTEKSIMAAEVMIERLSKLSENDFFIYLLSGGTSALLEKPISPITLGDFRDTTNLLLENSVPIEDINVIRKHLSAVKGGRLAGFTRAKGLVLTISDVVGDDLGTIGSAPLYYDNSNYGDAYDLLVKYGLWDKISENVKNVIEGGIAGVVGETPKKENINIRHHIIGNNSLALDKAREKAGEYGLKTRIVNSQITGEADVVARGMISVGRKILKTRTKTKIKTKTKAETKARTKTEINCLLFGGETTVTLKGTGRGGRNQQMCLSALSEIKDDRGIVFLSAGTDGIDGNSKAAGAVVDYKSYEMAKELNLDIQMYLNNNDSYNLFKQTGDLILTGPTGTNVMDITILLVNI